MDRHLKERLVGAAVLVAAAIILIPEMLSGPHDAPSASTQLLVGEADANGVKTYTIDLSKPTQVAEPASAPTFLETTPAPPPEKPADALPQEQSQESKPQAVNAAQAASERDQRLLQEYTEQTKSANKPAESPTATEAPSAINPPPAAGGWAVQVASFGVRATSERMAAELKAKGFPAFVMSFAAKGQTMYRVRVGPVADRAAAEALLKKIKPLHPDATVAPP